MIGKFLVEVRDWGSRLSRGKVPWKLAIETCQTDLELLIRKSNLQESTSENLQKPSGLREFAGEDVEEAGYRAGEQQQVAQLELDDQGDQSDTVEQAHVQHHAGALAIREHLLEQTQWLLVQFDGEMDGDRDHRADQ